jgi:hypothetical protein
MVEGGRLGDKMSNRITNKALLDYLNKWSFNDLANVAEKAGELDLRDIAMRAANGSQRARRHLLKLSLCCLVDILIPRGMRVATRPDSCFPSEAEEGCALAIEGGYILVGWDQGGKTLVERANLVII